MVKKLLTLIILLLTVAQAGALNRDIILATTTSTQDTGLLDDLIPLFEKQTGYRVKTIAVGTGQALAMGERGEADVLLVHSPAAEEKFMAKGCGLSRRLVMHNDFVIVGPGKDPAGIKGLTAAEAIKKISSEKTLFVSRGDDSGTHKLEKSLWEKVGIKPAGDWYIETGQGMAETLRIAEQKRGYTITDRGTYLSQRKLIKLQILVEKDKPLINQYSVIVINPDVFPNINPEGARVLADFFLSKDTQLRIKNFGVDKYGEALFTPDGLNR